LEFEDIFYSKTGFFSVGIEKESGSYYISIPVSNRLVDYEEYYKLDRATYEKYSADLEQLKFVADECRKRMRDKDLFYQPGSDRGIPK
jgi:hypothetical protein